MGAGIGDPTPMGWVTVGVYALAAIASARAAIVTRRRADTRAFAFWAAICVLYVLLGINKQLDLQSLGTELARINAHAWGWYERRHFVQGALIVMLTLGAIGALLALLVTAPWRSAAQTLALTGTTFLLAFVVIRAASFHGVDEFLGTRWLGLRANWLLELPGIILAALGGVLATRGDSEAAPRTQSSLQSGS